jgi:hypothetical protein
MGLNINGTTGISGVDGSASAASIAGTDANTGLSFASDTVNINTGGTTRATVDSSGRLLLGTTTEGVSTGDTFTIATSSSTGMTLRSGTSNEGNIFFSDGTSGADEYRGSIQYNHGSNFLTIGTDGSERLRIDSSGNVGIGTNNPDYLLNVVKGGVDMCRFQQTTNNQSDGYEAILIKHAAATSGQNGIGLRFQNSGGTTVGKIDFGQSSTQYRTSSDYRLKENATVLSDGITRLKTLKPYRFNFIAEPDRTVDGFFAHEVTAVPEAISGTKDEVDSDNKPVYQGIDQSKLVPLLTAALQEAIAKIEVLETKVAALEAG